jgi:hypothetical protein
MQVRINDEIDFGKLHASAPQPIEEIRVLVVPARNGDAARSDGAPQIGRLRSCRGLASLM